MVNKYDKGGKCWSRGRAFEEEAKRILAANGLSIRDSTPEQDYLLHADFYAFSKKWGRWVSVDAKAMKRRSRNGEPPQDTYAYIEWLNTAGFDGWTVKGADVILFERNNDMLCIAREDLLAFCEARVDKEKRVTSARDCLYCTYSRDGRGDLISMIRLDDLPKDKIRVWCKG